MQSIDVHIDIRNNTTNNVTNYKINQKREVVNNSMCFNNYYK